MSVGTTWKWVWKKKRKRKASQNARENRAEAGVAVAAFSAEQNYLPKFMVYLLSPPTLKIICAI